MRWQQLADLAEHQAGVVSLGQMVELGFGKSTITRLASERGWGRPHPGVYVLPGLPRTFVQRVIAAQHALPVPAVATGAAAAHLYNLRPEPPVIDLLVGERDRLTAPHGTQLTRTRTLLDAEVTLNRGIRMATGLRMLIDFAARAQRPDLRALLIDTRQRRLVDLARLDDRLAEIGPVRGRGVLKRLVWELNMERCDSVLELKVRRLLSRAGIPRPASTPWPVAVETGTLELDIAWPRQMIGIEVDGFAYHSSRDHLDRDHRRLNALTLAGWTVLRVSWDRVEHDPASFITEVRRLLSSKLEDRTQIRA